MPLLREVDRPIGLCGALAGCFVNQRAVRFESISPAAVLPDEMSDDKQGQPLRPFAPILPC